MPALNLLLVLVVSVLGLLGCLLVRPSWRWIVLLVISLGFYAFFMGWKILVMIGLAGLVFSFGYLVEQKKVSVWLGVILLLTPLILSNFFGSSDHFGNHLSGAFKYEQNTDWRSILMLLGMSYFTFNGISYAVDVHRGYVKPESNFLKLLLYLLYFPTMFAGPLHRAKYLIPQFDRITITEENLSRGFQLVLWGFFKTSVIGERLDLLLYNLSISEVSGFYIWLQGFLFFLFLYVNFSAFVDIFQGISQLFGIRLKDNFRNRVYLATNRKSYWQGWHITLNEWFRDYFFFVFSRSTVVRKYVDLLLLLTFALIGLWHGFALALLGWGLVSGLWIVLEKNAKWEAWPFPKARKMLGLGYHLFFTSVIALFFIMPDTKEFFNQVFLTEAVLPIEMLKSQLPNILIIILCFGTMDFHYAKAGAKRMDDHFSGLNSPTRWLIYAKLTLLILLFGVGGGISNYYIQF